jgi:ribokinase
MAKRLNYEVITIGSATRDVFMASKRFQVIRSSKFITGRAECVSLGSKIDVDQLVMSSGGGGTNSAATFASLGYRTAVISRVGEDSNGRDVIVDMAKFGVHTQLVKLVKRDPTGYSVLLTAKDGERSVLVHRGASASFNEKDIAWGKLKAKWIYVTSLAGNTALLLKIAKHAKKHKIKMAWNPGSGEIKHRKRGLDPILKIADVVSLNIEEAQKLGRTRSRDIGVLCKKIHQPGQVILLTDGANGAYAHRDGETFFARPSNVKVISRTGAGDAFGSGVVAALGRKMSLEDALRIGTINAQSVIQSFGAKMGILTTWPSMAAMKKIKIRAL